MFSRHVEKTNDHRRSRGHVFLVSAGLSGMPCGEGWKHSHQNQEAEPAQRHGGTGWLGTPTVWQHHNDDRARPGQLRHQEAQPSRSADELFRAPTLGVHHVLFADNEKSVMAVYRRSSVVQKKMLKLMHQ